MAYSVITSRIAKRDIADIGKYIATESQSLEMAIKVVDEIERQILDLNQMPKRYALVSDERLSQKGFRSIPIKNYIIFYVVEEQAKTVNIVGVLHNKRDWINLL